MFNTIKKLISKNKIVLKSLLKVIKRFRKGVYIVFFSHLPVDGNVILFCSHLGKSYSCNPKAIYEELLKDDQFSEYRYVWAFKDISAYTIDKGVKVKYGSVKYLFYLSISKYWIFNAKMPYYYAKKKEQVYLQTWHGTPLKRLAADIHVGEETTFYRSEMSKDEMTKSYLRDSLRYDYMISPNPFSTNVFQSAFEVREDVLIETGYPRNDILVNAGENDIRNLKIKYGIPEGKTILLYAPTWRDNVYDTSGYTFELEVDFDKWYERLGDDFIVIYKPHYLVYNTSNKEGRVGFIYDASECEDINDLYLMSDILITDYSSVFFDYGVLKRPILFYMYDLEDYRDNLRGFYLDIYTELPGPILKEEEEILQNILDIENVKVKYKDRMDEFFTRFCILHNGLSSKKVIDIVLKK